VRRNMVKAEKNVMEAFASPHGRIIKEFLEQCRDDKIEKLLVAEDNEMYRTQGAAQEYNELLTLANNSAKGLHS